MQKGGRSFVLVLALAALWAAPSFADDDFVRGDVNGDGIVTIADSVNLNWYLFMGGDPPLCFQACDANIDDHLNIADAISILGYLFAGKRIPTYEEEPPSDALTCESGLHQSPSLDTGVGLALDEVVAAEEEIVVPLRVFGRAGALHAWQCRIVFPTESLQYVRTEFRKNPESETIDFKLAELCCPGKLQLGVYYCFMLSETRALYEVESGAVLADLVFKKVGTPSGRALLAIDKTYGHIETVFDAELPPVFPWTGLGLSAVIFGAGAPAAPTGLAAEVTGGGVRLTWSNAAAYDQIVVERNGAQVGNPLPGTTTAYTDDAPSGEHCYRVRGLKAGASSTAPAAFAARWTVAAPTGFTYSADKSTNTIIWTNQGTYTAIEVFRNGALVATLPGNATTYVDREAGTASCVYHIRSVTAAGYSPRQAVLAGGTGVATDFGLNAVRNLTCLFTAPGALTLAWEPPAAGDRLDVVRDRDTVATLAATATGFVDHPSTEPRRIRYQVRTYIGDVLDSQAVCTIAYLPGNAIRRVRMDFLTDPDRIAFTWENEPGYIGIQFFKEGELIATLPGDATSFQCPVDLAGVAFLTFRLLPHGSDYMTNATDMLFENPAGMSPFLRGDVNWDGRASTSDALYLRRYLFTGGNEPVCQDAADANNDGNLNIADQIAVLGVIYADHMFPEPYPLPGYDPTGDGLTCGAGELAPGMFTDDLVRVGTIEAAPGEEVRIPIFITNSIPIEAFQFVIRYDPAVFTPTAGFNGDFFADTVYYDSHTKRPDFAGVEARDGEDYLVIGAIWNFIKDSPVPPGTDQLLAFIPGRVSPDAQVGTTIELEPTNGPGDEGTGEHRLMNEITSHGDASLVAFHPRTKEGFVNVKDNPTTMDFLNFLRADANNDSRLDIADPIFTLSYLFAGGKPPVCPDASDVNDDGVLDVADAISGLSHLFDRSLPPGTFPGFGSCALDKTEDLLGSCKESSCRK